MKGSECQNCDHKTPGCHDRCISFLAEKLVDLAQKAEIEQATRKDRVHHSYMSRNAADRKKAKRNHRR